MSALYLRTGGSNVAISLQDTAPSNPYLVIRMSGANKYIPLVNVTDSNASNLRTRINKTTYALKAANTTSNGRTPPESIGTIIPDEDPVQEYSLLNANDFNYIFANQDDNPSVFSSDDINYIFS